MSDKISQSIKFGIILSMIGGFLDAYTYVFRGGVFANSQTGNIVLMGISFANSEYSAMLRYLIPIFAYILGVVLVEWLRYKYRNSDNHILHNWKQLILSFEMLIILICMICPQGKLDVMVTVFVSFICALQSQTFRKLHGSSYVTTTCTGNIRTGISQLFVGINNKDKNNTMKGLMYFVIVGFFVLGVLIGVFFTHYFGQWSLFVVFALLSFAYALMFNE